MHALKSIYLDKVKLQPYVGANWLICTTVQGNFINVRGDQCLRF